MSRFLKSALLALTLVVAPATLAFSSTASPCVCCTDCRCDDCRCADGACCTGDRCPTRAAQAETSTVAPAETSTPVRAASAVSESAPARSSCCASGRCAMRAE